MYKETNKMLMHFIKEFKKPEFEIISTIPPKKSWYDIDYKDIEIVKEKEHEVAYEWELVVFETYKFGVVKNQHGYYIQQLKL